LLRLFVGERPIGDARGPLPTHGPAIFRIVPTLMSLLWRPVINMSDQCTIKLPTCPGAEMTIRDSPIPPSPTAKNRLDGTPAVERLIVMVTASSVDLGGAPGAPRDSRSRSSIGTDHSSFEWVHSFEVVL
jgi:hypothetical protein